jgi:hypothetical protein
MKMDQERIVALLKKYRFGEATDEDILLIENLMEQDLIQLEDFDDMKVLEKKIDHLETPSPSLSLDNNFYKMLAAERKSQKSPAFSDWFSFDFLLPRLAFASITFIIGIGIGYLVFSQKESQSANIDTLSSEVKSLKEILMLSLLEQGSATDRLKAVSLSSELDVASESVTTALIKTLNNDENDNVRLAALEALKPFCDRSDIRKALIQSIAKQKSPLVQIALAELMASLQERSSVNEFEKILKDKRTPEEVRKRIRQNIQTII